MKKDDWAIIAGLVLLAAVAAAVMVCALQVGAVLAARFHVSSTTVYMDRTYLEKNGLEGVK